ncbi:MAG: hypothetical protein QOI74_2542 [Micromonosporaceae bacterium]|jgi:hypothetical protein|nr:hypothetical protein [Micromonosporaceae bacterium]MDT5038627.1 hypothetical protein [Micromonosporaceae bacterium]
MAPRSGRTSFGLSRRSVLTAAAGTAGLGLIGVSAPARAASEATTGPQAVALTTGPLAPVPLLPAGAPVRTAFAPAEQLYALFLAICAPMANDINDSDTADRGFMSGNWWRTPNNASNARVQEHVSTLSWFYANQRSWNPYFQNAALLDRLDAAVIHYLSLQQTDGSFPENSRTEHALAPTGFGIGYLAKTLRNLRQINVLPDRRAQLNTSLQAAMRWLLNPANAIWANQIFFANQVCGGLAGSTVALQLTAVADIQAMLNDRMNFFGQHAQSTAGFFYEVLGMDIGYNFQVMLPELGEIFVRNGSAVAASMATRFADWFGYVMLREPNRAGYIAYTGASARTEIPSYDEVPDEPHKEAFGSHLIPAAPALAAFYPSQEDKAAARAAWAAQPGPAPALPKGGLTEPREMALLFYGDALPTAAARNAAIAQLPYLRSTEWGEIRRDTAVKQDYLFVRRPTYYFGGFFGTRPSTTMRSGVGFLWHPTAGTIVHSQQTDTECWGTVAGNGPDASTSLTATYQLAGAAWNGAHVAPGASAFTVNYQRVDGTVSTVLTLAGDGVTRAVRSSTAASEQIPLMLLPSDTITFSNGAAAHYGQNASASATGVTIRRGSATVAISWGSQLTASFTTTSRTFLRDAQRRIHVLRIPHSGQLTTKITVS